MQSWTGSVKHGRRCSRCHPVRGIWNAVKPRGRVLGEKDGFKKVGLTRRRQRGPRLNFFVVGRKKVSKVMIGRGPMLPPKGSGVQHFLVITAKRSTIMPVSVHKAGLMSLESWKDSSKALPKQEMSVVRFGDSASSHSRRVPIVQGGFSMLEQEDPKLRTLPWDQKSAIIGNEGRRGWNVSQTLS